MLGLLGGLSSVAGIAGNGISTAFSWLTTGLSALRAAFSFVFGQMMFFGQMLIKAGALMAGVLVGGLVSFGAAIVAASKASMEYSRSIIDLRNATGRSTGGALGMAQRFGAFGFAPGDLANGGQYYGITRMTGRMFGANADDPVSINARAQSFGGGLMGFSMRNALLSSLGLNNPRGQWLANLPQNKVREQAAWQGGITAKFNLSPEVVRAFAEDLPLLVNRFTVLKDLLITKIGSVALPYITRAFEGVSDFLSTRGAQIGELVGKAVEWVMNSLQILIDYLISNGPKIAGVIMGALEFLWGDLPVLVVGGMQAIVKGAMSFADTLAGWGHAIANQLRLFDESKGALYDTVKSIAEIFDGLINTFHFFGAAMATAQAVFNDIIVAQVKLIPGLKQVMDALGFKFEYQNPLEASANYFNAHPASNLAGSLGKLQNGTATKWADALDSGADKLSGFAQGAGGSASDFLDQLNKKLGPVNERRANFEKLMAGLMNETEKGNKIAEKTARNTERTADGMNGFGARIVGVATAHLVEDLGLKFMGS